LAKFKDNCPIKVAASVSNPFDFHKAGNGVKDTMFDGFLAQMMQNWARRFLEDLAEELSFYKKSRSSFECSQIP